MFKRGTLDFFLKKFDELIKQANLSPLLPVKGKESLSWNNTFNILAKLHTEPVIVFEDKLELSLKWVSKHGKLCEIKSITAGIIDINCY